MIIRFRFTLFILGCVFFCAIHAQQPSYLHYTVDEGFPSNEVYDVYEDSLGYIWFATDHGVSRFDGYSFRNYSTADGLVHNTVFGFYEDSRKRVWVRTFNSALCCLENDGFKPYIHNAQLQAFLGPDFIQRFAFDQAGNLWFVSIRDKLRLHRQDARTGIIEPIDLPDGFNAFIRELDSGEFIAGVDKTNSPTITSYNYDTLAFTDHTWLFQVQTVAFSGRDVVRCRRKAAGSYMFSFDAQLVVIDNRRISFHTTFPEVVFDCYVDPDNQYWLCMNGFFRFTTGVPNGPTLLAGFPGTSMLRDRMGNYWFATIDAGVFMARNIQVTTLNASGKHSLGELLALSVYKNNLVALDNKSSVFRLEFSEAGIDTLNSEKFPESFSRAYAFHHFIESRRFYIGRSVYEVNGPDFRWSSFKRTSQLIHGGAVRGYAHTHDSTLVAGNIGWYIMGPTGKQLYNSAANGFSGFCTAIGVGPDYKIWVGTSNGLYIVSENKTVPFEPQNAIFRQRVTDIEFGTKGEIFVSTRGGGLIVVDGKRQYNLLMKDGLSSDLCGNICVDDSIVWLCSNKGLNRIAMRKKPDGLSFHIEQINTQHGLQSMMVNDAVRAGDFLFLATGKGLAWFDVNTFRLNPDPPPVYIHTFLSNNHEAKVAARDLNWDDNNISIGFIALLFRSPGTVNYRYKLQGYETGWNYTTERMARYFNLPPGEYTFVVSAMNENGIWNDKPATLEFYIPAHYSQTTWFRALIIFLVLAAIVAVSFYYLKQQHNRARTVLALAHAEQKALRAQMKPHFIFNSLNSIQNFILNRDEDSANIYLTSFAQLMRRVLDHSRFSTIALQEELDTMGLYLELEKLRFGSAFHFTIRVQPDVQPSTLLIPPLFIQPYLENAIWHGLQLQKESPQLRIDFSIAENKLVCVIEDNGIGRKRSMELQRTQQHNSMGMKNVEERIALLNSTTREKISVEITDLSDSTGSATGTRVTLYFPVNRKEEF
ncbi:MAG TPA: histidine kinase [Bacteroidia bacterium]|nr:histidine kinase [Bacteroidia bacterium]